MAAFDATEQLYPQTLDLIGADARAHRIAGSIEVAVQKIVGESPHGQLRAIVIFEQHRAVSRHGDGGMKCMRLAAQSDELVACRLLIRSLAEHSRAERECLIGA